MCFAGIEGDVKDLVLKVAAKADVKVVDARIDHGHLRVLVENRGWVRSTDLLEHVEFDRAEEDEALTTQPAVVRHLQQIPAYLAPGR
ncbi:MAG TPA: hypothetical protein VH327_04040 [Gammaproteobacteria bacterium]|jgi:hypothetical protein|nr:hypothetical protein [Gammaproteobacteria bacterium]